MNKKVVVIGAGIAGLASSIRMAIKGYDVHVFEGNNHPGGKLSSFKFNGYRFDAGPPLFTMPNLIEDLFILAGENPSNYFKYKKKKISCNYFWSDKKKLKSYSNREDFMAEIQKVFGEDKKKVDQYFKMAKKKYDLTNSLFLEKSIHKLKTFISKDTFKALLKLNELDLFKTLHEVNSKYFSSPQLIQLFDRYATYNGSNPYQTSGIMTIIQHLEGNYGTYVPEKGMYSIAYSLYELAKRKGVRFNFNNNVTEICLRKNKSDGIISKNGFTNANIIISNMDIYPTYKKLLPNVKAPKLRLNQERSSSALIFYWGIKDFFKELDLHNVFFSDDYQNEFKAIFEKKTICDDPTIYLNVTSKEVSSDAPVGHENWYILINAPADTGQDWSKIVTVVKKQIISKLSRVLGKDISQLIECEKVLTPPMIQQKTKSHMGALYGASSNKNTAAFLRHPNFSNKIKNLYFCGGSVHPGGGIPLCLLSAKIVDDMIPRAV